MEVVISLYWCLRLKPPIFSPWSEEKSRDKKKLVLMEKTFFRVPPKTGPTGLLFMPVVSY